jgi:hypothetical protein
MIVCFPKQIPLLQKGLMDHEKYHTSLLSRGEKKIDIRYMFLEIINYLTSCALFQANDDSIWN